MFERIKYYYNSELWTLQRVWSVVGKAITEEEYTEITGLIYTETQ